MAAVSITAANVAPAAGARIRLMTAGAALTRGQVVYEDASDGNKAKLADANASAAAANVCGIVVADTASGGLVPVQVAGDITIGGTVVAGTVYQVGATAGSIVPNSDAATSGWYPGGIIGVAISTTVIRMAALPNAMFYATAI